MTSMRESRSESPRLSAASTSPARSVSASSARLAAIDDAVIVPPSTMPNTGTSATPVSGTTPVSSSSGMTASIPTAREARSHGEPRLASLRRAAVTDATANMTASTRIEDQSRAIAAASTKATAAN